ncbi:MAG: DUF2330 domain-containing protein [Myxococcales bacterium]|nr:DUF2330 domain-containing protein [Myxococcales bacterium]
MMRLTLLIVVAVLAQLPSLAWACGGFFCFTQPVDQSAERILYVQKGGQVTVHIQISYTGDDKSFSWVLPLQKAPQGGGLQPSSDTIFQLLEQYTSPSFQLQWKNMTNECYAPICFAEDSATGRPPSPNGTTGGVQVLLEENVGPYKAVVIQGNSGADILKWLNDNKYQQPKSTEGLLDVYAKEKFVFLALQLQKDKGAGDLVPIAVTLDETGPCLPIRLTALATAPDMPIVAWIVGKSRAIPKNFLHVELNDAVINWLSAADNYKTVVTKAVDLGSGHAFLTEMAKKTAAVPIAFAKADWNYLDFQKITDPSAFLALMMTKQIPRTSQIQGLIKKYIKKDIKYAAVKDQEFYNCIQNFKPGGIGNDKCKEYHDSVVALGFDGAAFAKDLNDFVILPLKGLHADYQAAAYLTRLYTTLSANEMTKDPIFGFNAELPDVSNLHTAEATPICENGSKQASKAKLKFADGKEITYDIPKEARNNCMFDGGGVVKFGKGAQPMNTAGGQALKKVQVLDETGPALDIDQSAADLVDAQLNFAKLGSPSLSAAFIAKLPKITWDPYYQGAPTTTTPAADAGSAGTGAADAGSATGSSGTGGSSAKPAAANSGGGMCTARATGGDGLAVGLLLAMAFWLARRRYV